MKTSKVLITVMLLASLLLSACATAGTTTTAANATQAATTAAVATTGAQAAESTTAAAATSAQAAGNATTTAATSAQTTAAVAETPAITANLTIEVWDRGSTGSLPVTDNYHTQWIAEHFGAEYPGINLTYVPVPRAQEIEKLNILMASGEAPDICALYDELTLYSYIAQGGVADITDAVEKYGPNIQKFLEASLPYGVFDGTLYALTAKRINTAMQGYYIRKDWLDALNLPVPTTTMEFYEACAAFKQQDPGGLGAEVWPFVINADYSEALWPINPILDSFTEPMAEEDFYCLPRYLWPGVKEGFRLVNKMFSEGLINPDFPLDNDKVALRELISTGKAGSFINNTGFPLGNSANAMLTVLKENVPGADLIPMDPFVNSEGVTRKQVYPPTGLFAFIPVFSKNVDAAIIYLDWLHRDDNRFILQNGVEGLHYEMVDGIPQRLEPPEDDPRSKSPGVGDLLLLINGQDLGDPELNMRLIVSGQMDPHYREIYQLEYEYATKNGYVSPRFERPISAEAKYNSVLSNQETKILVNSIIAAPADFDATYDSLVNEYLGMGGQEIIDEKRIAYKEMMD